MKYHSSLCVSQFSGWGGTWTYFLLYFPDSCLGGLSQPHASLLFCIFLHYIWTDLGILYFSSSRTLDMCSFIHCRAAFSFHVPTIVIRLFGHIPDRTSLPGVMYTGYWDYTLSSPPAILCLLYPRLLWTFHPRNSPEPKLTYLPPSTMRLSYLTAVGGCVLGALAVTPCALARCRFLPSSPTPKRLRAWRLLPSCFAAPLHSRRPSSTLFMTRAWIPGSIPAGVATSRRGCGTRDKVPSS